MQSPATDFGNAGVVRFSCDACGRPLRIMYRSEDGGEFCSKQCLDNPESKKVKISQPEKVKTAPAVKVKIAKPEKVKTPAREKVTIVAGRAHRLFQSIE